MRHGQHTFRPDSISRTNILVEFLNCRLMVTSSIASYSSIRFNQAFSKTFGFKHFFAEYLIIASCSLSFYVLVCGVARLFV